MDIGERIAKLREHKGWSQRELANRIDINFSVMNRIESGSRPVKDVELDKIATVLNVSTDFLLGRDVEKSNDNNRNAIIQKIATEFPDIDIMFKDLESLDANALKEVYDFIKFKARDK